MNEVIRDISQEFQLPPDQAQVSPATPADSALVVESVANPEFMDERMMRLEKSIVSVLSILKKIVATPAPSHTLPADNHE